MTRVFEVNMKLITSYNINASIVKKQPYMFARRSFHLYLDTKMDLETIK